MRLIVQCAICQQTLVVEGRTYQQVNCPRCKARVPVRQPRLSEQEIMGIIDEPAGPVSAN